MYILKTILGLSDEPYVYQVAVKNAHLTEKRSNGLQKLPVNQLVVHTEGCLGDFNQYRTKHKLSTPDRALSLITKQMLDTLTSEGWGPIMPGDLGENITIDGEMTLEIGERYSIGTVLLEITELIEPCNQLQSLSYIGKEKRAAFLKTLKNRRGWYAKVLTEGIIIPGDKVIQII